MKKFNVASIETFGLLDGPGIRVVIFLQGCHLRCKFCHNPETWSLKTGKSYSLEELVNFIKKYKSYFKNTGGVTFSGGEPLIQTDNLIELCKCLKKEAIHIALDTSGVGNGNISLLLDYVDLVLFSIKSHNSIEYKDMTGIKIEKSEEFIKLCNEKNKKIWIRHVIIPGYNDDFKYMDELKKYIKQINNVEKIELLPYHNMAIKKYEELNMNYILKSVDNMNVKKCEELYQYLIK